MNTPLHQELARAGFPGLAQIVSDLRDGQLDLQASMEELKAESSQHKAAYARLLGGFPADDIEGHRRYHESVIEWRELRNKLVREALTKMVGAGVLAGFGWLALAFWQAFKVTVTK
jgi:hypothetical protein